MGRAGGHADRCSHCDAAVDRLQRRQRSQGIAADVGKTCGLSKLLRASSRARNESVCGQPLQSAGGRLDISEVDS